MAKKAYIFLAEGFEETEALAPYDVLRRGGVNVELVSISNEKMVQSSHGVGIMAHRLYSDGLEEYDMLMLPGGMPGTLNLNACEPLKDEIVRAAKVGKVIGAICAAPMVLGGLGLLNGKAATCFPGFEEHLTGATITGAQVVTDGLIVTGIGAGAAYPFGLALLAKLTDEQNAQKIKEQIILK